MPDNPITVPLPQDLPTDWTYGQTIGATGADVGLTQQHGYNYLMQQVNAAQQAAQEIGSAFENLTASDVEAAPDGFGIGTYGPYVTNLNDAVNSGFYTVNGTYQNGPADSGAGFSPLLVLSGSVGNRIAQIYYGLNADFTGCIATRYYNNALETWSSWEWANPPMQIGVEYRTAEQWNGNTVYAKLIKFGALPNATTSTLAHGIANVANILSASGSASNGQSLPCTNFGGSENDSVAVSADTTNIYVTTTQNHSTLTASILLKYTKTTD